MALVFDAGTTSSVTGASSLTYSHTVGVGVNTVMVVQPSLVDALAGAATINSVTYATVGLSLITNTGLTFILVAAFDVVMSEWILAAPATGANNVVITASEACDFVIGGSQSWFGAAQSNMTENGATNTAATGQPAVTVSSASGRQVLAHALGVETLADGMESSETERWDFTQGTDSSGAAVGASQVGAASVVMDWTGIIDGVDWGATGFSLVPFVGHGLLIGGLRNRAVVH